QRRAFAPLALEHGAADAVVCRRGAPALGPLPCRKQASHRDWRQRRDPPRCPGKRPGGIPRARVNSALVRRRTLGASREARIALHSRFRRAAPGMNRVHDALVIGGGPAGSTAARLLSRAGWSVVMVEKTLFPRRKVCGEFISATS